jgi:hypothetical protein
MEVGRMKTAMKIIAFMAVGYILAEVWYAGFNEGWRQASETDCSASREDSAVLPRARPRSSGIGGIHLQRL